MSFDATLTYDITASNTARNKLALIRKKFIAMRTKKLQLLYTCFKQTSAYPKKHNMYVDKTKLITLYAQASLICLLAITKNANLYKIVQLMKHAAQQIFFNAFPHIMAHFERKFASVIVM